MEVIDKRAKSEAIPIEDLTAGILMSENKGINIEPPPNPVDELMERTFQFVISQPEWPYILQLPKNVRKKLGQDFGKILTRFPHFNKAM